MRSSKRNHVLIDEDTIIPALRSMTEKMGSCADSWGTYEFECVRADCGPKWAGTPTDDIRRQAVNLRKRGAIGRVNGHGPNKSQQVPSEYQMYLQSPHWRDFRECVLEFWGYTCSMCDRSAEASNGPLEVHHRRYERGGRSVLYREIIQDCICCCKECHKVADVRRKRAHGIDLGNIEVKSEEGQVLFA